MSLPKLRLKNGRFASLQQIINSLQNPAPLLDQVGQYLKKSTQERISTTKKSPSDQPWAPWADVTAMAREKKGTAGRGLLFDSGALYDSIDYQVQAKSVIVGAGVSYARFLQAGTFNMPARPFIGFSQQDKTNIHNMVVEYLKTR